ncbi:MAG: radical SAM protein [Desulfobacteraceae bacterium]
MIERKEYMDKKEDVHPSTPLMPLVANKKGEIFELPDFGAAAAQGRKKVLLTRNETIDMPYGSELMMLPGQRPIVFDFDRNRFKTLYENPYAPEQEIFPVAVFNSPGFVSLYSPAYERHTKQLLPLFSYGAAAWGAGGFRSAALCVDKERRQDLRLMPYEGIVQGIEKMRKKYPDNRLMRHIEKCALEYGCPAAKNFFLQRFEAPLPTAKACNARCLGCISLQTDSSLVSCQERISFTPSPHEIAELSLEHISNVEKSVVSFGQGCEGDPLTAFHVIEPALKIIRKKTDAGTINMNTNAGMTRHLEALFDAGLDGVRVSMNSVREPCYTAYFRPQTYEFKDVVQSIDTAGKKGKFVSINYLNIPGVTDSESEFNALVSFIEHHPVNMIQWRNLNYDPLAYVKVMEQADSPGSPLGMAHIIKTLKKKFPRLIHGYFNPPVKANTR